MGFIYYFYNVFMLPIINEQNLDEYKILGSRDYFISRNL